MDVLFVDLPRDMTFPVSEWCLGYRYLIAALRENGFSAALLHPRRPQHGSAKRALIDDILASNASIVGFTTYDVQLYPLLLFIHELRRAGLRSHITLGGMCASAAVERILEDNQDIDSVVFGEGELSVVDLARRVVRREGQKAIPGVSLRDDRRVVTGEPRPLVDDLDVLPQPALDNFRDPLDAAPLFCVNDCVPILGSRGCYGKCSFCCVQRFYRSCPGQTWRGFSAPAVVREMSRATALTGLENVTFVDENFMGPASVGRQHASDIAREVKHQQLAVPFNFGCRPNDVQRESFELLKDAGLSAVTLGVESMSREALRLFNKGTTPEANYKALELLEALQIYAEITFIFFHPLSTLSEVRDNLDFVQFVAQSKYAYFNNHQPFSEFVPFFGTELTSRFTEMGLVTRDLRGYSVNYADCYAGFIARRVLDVPVDYLSRLRQLTSLNGSERLQEVRASLLDYDVYLNMIKLPGLVSDLCDVFERGAKISSDKVSAIVRQFDRETEAIHSLVQQFASHMA